MIQWGGGWVMCNFYNYTYRNASVFIQRKKEMAESVFEKYKGKENEAMGHYHKNTHILVKPFYQTNSRDN
jgi:hypothetical protein